MRRIPRERKRSRRRALHTIRQSGFIPPFLPLSFLLSRKEEASDHQKTTFPFFANLNAPFCRSRTFSEEPFNAAGIRHKGGVGLLTGPKENRSRQDSNCSAEEEAKNGIKEVVRSFTFLFPFHIPHLPSSTTNAVHMSGFSFTGRVLDSPCMECKAFACEKQLAKSALF